MARFLLVVDPKGLENNGIPLMGQVRKNEVSLKTYIGVILCSVFLHVIIWANVALIRKMKLGIERRQFNKEAPIYFCLKGEIHFPTFVTILSQFCFIIFNLALMKSLQQKGP